MRYYGCHVSSSGGYHRSLEIAQKLDINTIQIHPCPPQRWNTKPFSPGVEDAFLQQLPSSGVKKLFFHGIYLINLANPDPRMLGLARLSLTHDLELLSRMNGDGVIFHVGSQKHEPDESAALTRAAEVINRVLEETPANSTLLLEVAAGAGTVIGQRIEQLLTIYDMVEQKDRVGFALDTQHLWASGCNLKEDLETLINTVDNSVGIQKITAIHLNDSKTALGSKTDRHENLGQGTIGEELLRFVIHHPKLKDIPVILETPAMKDLESAVSEVAVLKEYLKER